VYSQVRAITVSFILLKGCKTTQNTAFWFIVIQEHPDADKSIHFLKKKLCSKKSVFAALP